MNHPLTPIEVSGTFEVTDEQYTQIISNAPIVQKEGDYTIIYDLSDECWFIPRILNGNLLTCKRIDIETLVIKGLVTVEYDKYDSSVGVIFLTEKGKEWKCDSWFERAKKWFE